MKTNIRLAHHFWQDRANARWNPSIFPYPELENAIRQNYALFEAERPKWKQFGNVTVFFDYRPAKDIYGRDIVPISFAFVPDCVNPELCHKAIAARLSKASDQELEIAVNLPEGSLRIPKKTKTPKPVIWLCLALAFLGGIWLFWNGKKEKAEPTVELASQKSMQQEETLNPTGISQSQTTTLKSALGEKASPSQNDVDSCKSSEVSTVSASPKQQGNHQAKPSLVCANIQDLQKMMHPCAASFLNEYCAGRISEKTVFSEWADKKEGIAECSRTIPRAERLYDANKLEKMANRELERIFKRK